MTSRRALLNGVSTAPATAYDTAPEPCIYTCHRTREVAPGPDPAPPPADSDHLSSRAVPRHQARPDHLVSPPTHVTGGAPIPEPAARAGGVQEEQMYVLLPSNDRVSLEAVDRMTDSELRRRGYPPDLITEVRRELHRITTDVLPFHKSRPYELIIQGQEINLNGQKVSLGPEAPVSSW
ncbi:hypothetical protein ACFQ7N_10635 [Streptomyces niveus]|uniref:hypothetical protein n=1 Tax=Streptomyces niveus TaxID=193462 RepID=UPI0036B09CDE